MIACWLFKFRSARALDTGRPLTADLEQHHSVCHSCRSFFSLRSALVKKLGREAQNQAGEMPLFLHGKIMERIRREQGGRSPVHGWPAWSLVAVVAVLCVGIWFLAYRFPRPNTDSAVVRSSPVVVTPATGKDAGSSVSRSTEIWASALTHPLESEVQAMVNDAQAVVAMLAQNFLPADLSVSKR